VVSLKISDLDPEGPKRKNTRIKIIKADKTPLIRKK
jgi:hypothetical protein